MQAVYRLFAVIDGVGHNPQRERPYRRDPFHIRVYKRS
jgi:hypothetical protein